MTERSEEALDHNDVTVWSSMQILDKINMTALCHARFIYR